MTTSNRGRPAKKRDQKLADEVRRMAMLGIPQDKIAMSIGMCKNTLLKLYSDELRIGEIKAEQIISQTAFQVATNPDNPNPAMLMFLLKTRFGYRETEKKELEVKNTTPIQLVIKNDLKE